MKPGIDNFLARFAVGQRRRRMAVRRMVIVATASAASIHPAYAQDWNNSDMSTKEVRALMHTYAKCVVARQGEQASEALVLNLDNAAIVRRYPKLISPNCLAKNVRKTTQMRFGGDLYRYALADALVSRELAQFDPAGIAAVPPLQHKDAGPAPSPVGAKGKMIGAKKHGDALKAYNEDVATAYLGRYGECVVRAAPADAKTLLLTVPDSAEESVRFKSLTTALGRCLPEGATLKFGRTALRGAIAVNYYRLAMAARAAAATTGTAG